MSAFRIPDDFGRNLDMANAPRRLDEVVGVANAIVKAGVALKPNLDHAAIFTDPPYPGRWTDQRTRLHLGMGLPMLPVTGRWARLHQRVRPPARRRSGS